MRAGGLGMSLGTGTSAVTSSGTGTVPRRCDVASYDARERGEKVEKEKGGDADAAEGENWKDDKREDGKDGKDGEDRKDGKGEWVRSAVLGGVDGIITSFAVVSGGSGAGLSPTSTLAVGFASLFADGVSMAVSELNSVRSPLSVAAFQAVACMLSFVAAGSLPLLSFLAASMGPNSGSQAVGVSAAVAGVELFGIGAARSWTRESIENGKGSNDSNDSKGSACRRRVVGGLLTLGTGAIAGAAAYGVATGISGMAR